MWPHDHLPSGVTISATVFIVGIAVIRLTLVRPTTVFGRLVNTLLGLDAAAALLREPVIARPIAAVVPGGLPTVFDIWHWLTVTAWTCGLGLALLHESRPARYRIRFGFVIGLSAAVGIVFLALSEPARAQGLSSIADHGGWRYSVYLALYSALPVIVSSYYFYVMKSSGTVWRPTTPWERVMVGALVGFGIASSIPICWIALSTTLDALGVNNAVAQDMFTVVSDALASGEPGLFVFAAVVVVFVPSSAQAVMQVLRLDRESRSARRLYPLWQDLTAAAPQVVFQLRPADNRKVSPQERLHRRRIEIHDAAEIVARYVLPLPAVVDDLIDTTTPEDDQEHLRLVTELVLAAERLAGNNGVPDGEPTAGRAEVPDERTLLRFWHPSKSLVHAAGRTAQRQQRDPLVS